MFDAILMSRKHEGAKVMDVLDMARFTLRVPKETLEKLSYIAGYNGRTKNKELEQMINSRIKIFENKHGPIITSQDNQN